MDDDEILRFVYLFLLHCAFVRLIWLHYLNVLCSPGTLMSALFRFFFFSATLIMTDLKIHAGKIEEGKMTAQSVIQYSYLRIVEIDAIVVCLPAYTNKVWSINQHDSTSVRT